jgi:hypothetical protein
MTGLPPQLLDPEARIRAALYRARLMVNRTPHLARGSRREGNAAIDILERQVNLNRVSESEGARAVELLNRAHPSIIFMLLQEPAFESRFAAPLRRLGLRGLHARLEEVGGFEMANAMPIHGPSGQRKHRDDLPSEERVDQLGRPLPPPPGYY